MVKKSCKICKTIYEVEKCPMCGSQEYSDEWKGRVIIFNPEESEVAKNLKISKKGIYAIKNK